MPATACAVPTSRKSATVLSIEVAHLDVGTWLTSAPAPTPRCLQRGLERASPQMGATTWRMAHAAQSLIPMPAKKREQFGMGTGQFWRVMFFSSGVLRIERSNQGPWHPDQAIVRAWARSFASLGHRVGIQDSNGQVELV